MCLLMNEHLQILLKEPDMSYNTREEQGALLQQVLSASDMDADEERIPGEGSRSVCERNVNIFIISL